MKLTHKLSLLTLLMLAGVPRLPPRATPQRPRREAGGDGQRVPISRAMFDYYVRTPRQGHWN